MLQDYYTLIIGGNDGSNTLDTVEVVSLDSPSHCIPNCMEDLSNIPTPIKGAVGTTFGKLQAKLVLQTEEALVVVIIGLAQ